MSPEAVPGVVVTESEGFTKYEFDVQVHRTETLACPKCGNRTFLRQFGSSPSFHGAQLIVDRCLSADCEKS